jgi:hypothetical protein
MKVMVIVKATASSEAGEMLSEALLAAMGAYNEELVKAGIMLAGEGLHPTAKAKRVRFDGATRTVIDGPFAETKEQFLGFYVLDCEALDDALAFVRDLRDANPGPVYELRPVAAFFPAPTVPAQAAS